MMVKFYGSGGLLKEILGTRKADCSVPVQKTQELSKENQGT